MKLSKIALLAIKGCDTNSKKRMIEAAGVAEQTFYRYLNNNDDNLTKMAVIKVIKEETGLTEAQILEVESVEQN